jgi:hypothetical protein
MSYLLFVKLVGVRRIAWPAGEATVHVLRASDLRRIEGKERGND